MDRAVKVLVAGWALAFGAALILFLLVLWFAGPSKAETIWGPIPLSALFVVGLFAAWRWLR
jgi:hypothetical protein